MKPHDRSAPGLPAAMQNVITAGAARMRRHVALELLAALAADAAKRETRKTRKALSG